MRHCDVLVDFHTGSFDRSNLPQVRADLTNPDVLEFISAKEDLTKITNFNISVACCVRRAKRGGIRKRGSLACSTSLA